MSEVVKILYQNESIRVEQILSYGEVSPIGFFYENNCDEWVKIICGNAVLCVDNTDIPLGEGDSYLIKAHLKHSVKYTSENCEWLCVYLG